MNLLDIIIICTLVFLIIKGLLRGFIREIASLAGVILGIVLANLYQPLVTEKLRLVLHSTPLLPLISFALVFAAVVVGCNLVGWLLKLAFKKAFLGWLDRFLGFCFALIKGVVITYLAIVILTFTLPSSTPLIAKSKLAPWITVSYQTMVGLIAPEHYQNLKKKFLEKKSELSDKAPETRQAPPAKDGQE